MANGLGIDVSVNAGNGASAIKTTGDAVVKLDGAATALTDTLSDASDALVDLGADASAVGDKIDDVAEAIDGLGKSGAQAQDDLAGLPKAIVDLGANARAVVSNVDAVAASVGGLGKSADQVQVDLADMLKSINEVIAAKAKLAGKTPKLLDLTADRPALEEMLKSFPSVVSANPSIKQHIDIANGKNNTVAAPSQVNLAGISPTKQGQAQFIDLWVTRLLARQQAQGKNKIDVGLTSQELLTRRQPKDKEDEKPKKVASLFDAAKQIMGKAIQGGAGGWAGQGVSSILDSVAKAKASGAGGIGMLAGGGLAAAGFAAYKIASAVDEGLDRAKEEAIGIDKFKRQLGDVGVGFDMLRENVRAAADGLGLTYEQSLKMVGIFARSSNTTNKDTRSLEDDSRLANQFARATGVGNEDSNKFFGDMRYAGATDNAQDSKRMALAMADAIKRTGSSVNADQMLQSISQYTAQIKDATLGKANAIDFADSLSGLMADHGIKASTAAAVVNQFDAGVRSGGVNDAGQAYQFQALDGNRLGYGRFKALQEGGMFASEKSQLGKGSDGQGATAAARFYGPMDGASDKLTGVKVMEAFNRDFFNRGDNKSRELGIDALATQFFGGNHSKAIAFKESYDKHGGEQGLNKTARMLEAAKIDTSNVNPEGIKLLADLANAGSRKELDASRQVMLERKDIDPKVKERIEKETGADKDDEVVRVKLAQIAVEMGQETTDGKKLIDAAVTLENSLTKFSQGLIPISIASRDLLGELVQKFTIGDSPALKEMREQKAQEQYQKDSVAIQDGTLLPGDKARLNQKYDGLIKTYRQEHPELSDGALSDHTAGMEAARLAELGEKNATALSPKYGGLSEDKLNEVREEYRRNKAKRIESGKKTAQQSGGRPADLPAEDAKRINDKYDAEAEKVIKATSANPAARVPILSAIEKNRQSELNKQAVALTDQRTPGALSEEQVKAAVPAPAASLMQRPASLVQGKSADRAAPLLPEIARVEKDLSMEPGTLAGLIQHESNFRSDVYGEGVDKNGNIYQSKAYGLGQMTPGAIKAVSPEFRAKFGRDYDQSNPTDQMYAAGMYWNQKRKTFGSAEKANQAYFAGDGGMGGVGVVSQRQVEEYGAVVARKQKAWASTLGQPAKPVPAPLEQPAKPVPAPPVDRGLFAKADPRRFDNEKEESIVPGRHFADLPTEFNPKTAPAPFPQAPAPRVESAPVKLPKDAGQPSPVKLPQNNPQEAAAEAKRQAFDFNIAPIMFSANLTLRDQAGQHRADPITVSGRVAKPSGSGARL